MPEDWIIRVQDKEYGPADLPTLHEWKTEGRILASNDARRQDATEWTTAARIPGLFGQVPPPVQEPSPPPENQGPKLSLFQILVQTVSVYRRGFFQYLFLTALILVPSVCADLTGNFIQSAHADADLRSLVQGGFAFCMMLLFLILWPVYIAGIQIVTAHLAAGERINFLGALNSAMRFWPRIVLLCIFVGLCFFIWTFIPVIIMFSLLLSGPSLLGIFFVLVLFVFQFWITSRLFINFMFWQQFAVLDNCNAAESLRRSKGLARSGKSLPWHRRPLWRGAIIFSLWSAVVLALNWRVIPPYWHTIMSTSDPQALMEALKSSAKSPNSALSTPAWTSWLQAILRPLLGIGFVLVYLDSQSETEP